MAFASGAVSFRRYQVAQCKYTGVDDAFLEALTANAFGRYSTAADVDVEVGWIGPEHVFDATFAAEKVAVGRFAHFALRVDRNSVPASIQRSYVAIEEEAALAASGREFLSKQEKREAKAAAKMRAEKEARSGAFRRIATFPVLFDLDKHTLYFGGTNVTANDKLQRIFADTFEGVIEPVTAHNLALNVAVAAGKKRDIEDARPSHLVPPPDEIDADGFSGDPEDRGFFGREFLSWLWHTVDGAEGMFELLDKTDVAATVTKTLQLKCDFNIGGSVSVRGDGPASMAEARAALASGKQPVKMGLLLAARAGEWAFTLDGVKFDVSGLALPPSELDDAAARLEERLESIADLAGVLDALFDTFLRTRLSKDWPARLKQMEGWAASGRQDRAPQPARLASA